LGLSFVVMLTPYWGAICGDSLPFFIATSRAVERLRGYDLLMIVKGLGIGWYVGVD